MVISEELLPEEADVLARVSAEAIDIDSMLVVQDVFRAADALRERLERVALSEHGLSFSSFTMLFCLWVWGPLETRELARRMGVSRPTVSGVTDTLERRALVARESDPSDARLRSISLSAEGERLFTSLYPRFNAEETAVCSVLATDERRSLVALLRSLIHSTRGSHGS